jgi:mRNA (guanine-N7-)-methyltransferase
MWKHKKHNNFGARKNSSIFLIRSFHNQIKRQLITESVDFLKENYNTNDIALLDLSCGKMGDLMKVFDNGIMKVVGFDIDEPSINEAKRRYNELLNKLKSEGTQKLPDYKFYVMDLSDSNNLEKIGRIIGNDKFDIVSCQFAIHYFFKSSETLNTFMTIASSYINKNAFFIATTMNGGKIKQMFQKNNVIQNDIFKITNNNTSDTPYNNQYTVALGKESDTEHYFANKDSIEYLVDIDELKRVADKFGLMFIGTTDFEEWYKKFPNLPLTESDKEFSFLNFSFVFMPKRD